MGWDQETGREGIYDFLLRFLGIDVKALLKQVIEDRLSEQGLTYEIEEDTSRNLSEGLYDSFSPQKVKFSDGRVFVEALTEISRGDDWGFDFYKFVEAGKPYRVRTEEYLYDGNDPHVSEEVIPGEQAIPSNLEELREAGNATSDGMGDEIVDFLKSQGITQAEFAIGDDE